MKKKMVSSTVYITEEQHRALAQLSGVTKVPVAEYVREGIDLVLAERGHLLSDVAARLAFEAAGRRERGGVYDGEDE